MSSKILVICDWEDGYLAALAAYIAGRKELDIRVITCKTVQGAEAIQKEMQVDYLFISASFKEEERSLLRAKKIFILAEAEYRSCEKETEVIYKYQSGDMILSALIKSLSDDEAEDGLLIKAGNKGSCKIIGICSPAQRIGKTKYALELGQKMAVKENVLYLNLELFGGYGGDFPEESKQTLIDVLYYSRQESKNLNLFLTTMAEQMGGMDYIAPAPVSEDVKAVKAEEWTSLLEQIARGCFYETVILDIDEGIQGLYKVLSACGEIHLLTVNHPEAEAKIRQFEQELTLLGYEDLLNRIIRKEQSG